MILRSGSRWWRVPPPTISPVVASTAASGSSRPVSTSAWISPRFASSASRSNAGRLAGSRSSGSVNAGRSASTSSSRGRRRTTSPARSSSGGTDKRGAWSRTQLVPGVQDREASVGVEAPGGEQRHAEVAAEERVAAVADLGPRPLDLDERVESEPAGTLEPALVAGPPERLQQCEAVAYLAGAEARAVDIAVLTCARRQLGSREQELLGQVRRGRRDDPRCAVAPLQPDLVVPLKLAAGIRGPGGEAVFDHGLALEHGSGLTGERGVVTLQEGMDVADEAVDGPERAERSAVQLLGPDPVRVATGEQCVRAVAPRLEPALLPAPPAHCVRGHHRPRRAPHQFVGLVIDVRTDALEQCRS